MVQGNNDFYHFESAAQFLDRGIQDHHLQDLSEATSDMLGSENCSVMLLEKIGDEEPFLRVCGSSGAMAPEAYREVVKVGQGIAGQVLASGIGLHIDDIRHSPFAHCARRGDDTRRSLMCVPIRLDERLVGVVNVSGRKKAGAFNGSDLKLLEAMALFIGKSLHVSQLQAILNSRFAQLAVIQDASREIRTNLAEALPNPDQVAKIMAKSFYKEMTRAGFASRQIIDAASEIIAQLSLNLNRHSKRLGSVKRTKPSSEV